LAQADLDYKADYGDDGLKLVLDTAKLGVKGLGYQQSDLSLTVGDMEHETDLSITYQNNILALQADKAKLTVQQLVATTPLAAKASSLSATTAYQLHYSDKHMDVIAKQADINAKGLQLLQTGKAAPMAEIPDLSIQGINFNLGKRDIKIAAATVNGAEANIRLNKDHTLEFSGIKTENRTDKTGGGGN